MATFINENDEHKLHIGFKSYEIIFLFVFLLLTGSCTSKSPSVKEKDEDLTFPVKEQFKDSVFISLYVALLNRDKVYKLDLSGQGLNEFPKDIFELKNLEVLDLSYNNIAELPSEISSLKKLKELKVSFNDSLLKLPKEIWLLSLEVLEYNNKHVTDFPKEFYQSTAIDFSRSIYGSLYLGESSEGKRTFCRNGKMGVLKSSGEVVMTPHDCFEGLFYIGLPIFRNNRCFIFKGSDEFDVKLGVMDTNFNILVNPTYEIDPFTCNFYLDYKSGLYPLLNAQGSNFEDWTYDFLDTNGKIVFNSKYHFGGCTAACVFMPEFSEGLCLFEDEQGKYGYFDTKGKVVIEPKYVGAGSFSEGLSFVIDQIDSMNFYYYFINKKGEKAFGKQFNLKPFEETYEHKYFTLHNMILCGMRIYSNFKNGKCRIKYWDEKENKEVNAIINSKGEIIGTFKDQYIY